MSAYDDYGDDRSPNPLAAYKPRVWKQERALDLSVCSKPEPTSKTNIPSVASHTKKSIKPSLQPYF